MVPLTDSDIIHVESERALPARIALIAERVQRKGFAVVHAWDNSEHALHTVGEHLGHIQRHIRANERGVVGETPTSMDWASFTDEYYGVNNEDFNPHTDGTYLHGAVLSGGRLYDVNPPRMLLLQMAQPAAHGGANYVVDAERVLVELLRSKPHMVKTLMKRDLLVACRDDMLSRGFPVFARDGARNKLRLRFRFDAKVYVAPDDLKAVRELNQHYFLNPEFQVRVPLAKAQILVVDNWRMLHAREKFVAPAEAGAGGERKLRRVWLAEDEPRARVNAFARAKENRAMRRFAPYAPMRSRVPFERRGHVQCGIDVTPELDALLRSL